jgi:hypothetical protein
VSDVQADSSTAWCCISTGDYYPVLRIFLESLRAHLPDVPCTVFRLAAPPPPRSLAMLAEFVELKPRPGQGASDTASISLQELAIAAKPVVLSWMLEAGHRHVIYADADLWMLAYPGSLLAALRHADIVLTPHFVLPHGPHHDLGFERVVLTAGTFNSGIVGVTAGTSAQHFCAWWAQRTLSFSDRIEDRASDQRWLNIAPYLFPGVCALSDPGVNAGHWSIDAYGDVTESACGIAVRGHRITLMHMSGFEPGNPARLTRHRPALLLPEGSPLRGLAERYNDLLTRR